LQSSAGGDFNYDFGVAFTGEQQRNGAEYNFQHVDELPPQREGMSAFALRDGVVHHTYSTYGRGVDEEDLDFPGAWWGRHDEHEDRQEEAAR
jgi:predicted dithiol-disulfide oxidoreductase (DUF899 family)